MFSDRSSFGRTPGVDDERWPGLANLSQSIFAALGASGFQNRFKLERSHSICLLLIDGLGWNLLEAHAHKAPFLASLMQANGSFKVGFPSTTAASLSSLTCGQGSGVHGIVGCSFALDIQTAFAPLMWSTFARTANVDAAGAPDARSFISAKGAWERAQESGIAISNVIAGKYAGSDFSQAIYKAGAMVAAPSYEAFPALIAGALATEMPAFCYAYFGDLDFCGHLFGPGSEPWLKQLEAADRLALAIARSLPRETTMMIVADHGMATLAPESTHDFDEDRALQEGVTDVFGDIRARHVHTASDQEDSVRQRWQNRLGEDFLVLSKAQAIGQGLFGDVVLREAEARMGDLIVIPTGRGGIIRSQVERDPSSWLGHHGALTDDDQVVPLLMCAGQALY